MRMPGVIFWLFSVVKTLVGHYLPFIRSRRQVQGQDCNAPVSNWLMQVNVVSNLFTGFCRKIEHIEI